VKKLRISIVQYLNTAPLVWGFTHGPFRALAGTHDGAPLETKYELSFTVPSQCAEDLRSGAADVAIIPAIELQRIDDLVVLPDLAIASKRHVRSLRLIAKAPIKQVRRIALDRSSRSTQALTRILCAEHWRIAPEFFQAEPHLPAMLQNADAALLIGDPALRLSLAAEAGAGALAEFGLPANPALHIYDVVEEWRRLTNLPAVLAVWAARASVATPELIGDFLASRDAGLRHLPEICAEAAPRLQLPERDLRLYLEQNIDYSLDQENLQGLRAFFHHSAALGLIDAAKPFPLAASPARQSA